MANGWRVTGQRGSEDLVNGRWTDVMIVSVATDDGTTKDFRIPEARYTPENVSAIVNEWFEKHQGVANI